VLGAIIGDIVGSIYECHNIKTKQFELFDNKSIFTDDSVMTCAVAQAMIDVNVINDENDTKKAIIRSMIEVGRQYPNCGYGGSFRKWVLGGDQQPYNSFGNGSAMRVSSVAWVSDDMETVMRLAKNTAEVSHNHPEGILGAQAVAASILLARRHGTQSVIRSYVHEHFYNMDFSLDSIRDGYRFDVTCQGTVPQAIMAFLESTSFEDTIRNAISIGGDSDTLAAISGSIAEAAYGIPEETQEKAVSYIDGQIFDVVSRFSDAFPVYSERCKSFLALGQKRFVSKRDSVEQQVKIPVFWVKVVGFLQQNWAIIQERDGITAILFFDDLGRVFDELDFQNQQQAVDGLKRNGFSRYGDAQDNIRDYVSQPEWPLHHDVALRAIYSSGEFWNDYGGQII
jgi:type I restriction enzyme M protein